jgi:hypothetical protein
MECNANKEGHKTKQFGGVVLNGDDIEHWGQDHFATMALFRTLAAGVNIFLSLVLIVKVFEVI